MNDDEIHLRLRESIERRVRRVNPDGDVEQLLAQVERRHTRTRRRLVVGLVASCIAAAAIGFVAGQDLGGDEPDASIAVPADGVPASLPARSTAAPADVDAATTEVIQAFHDALDGGTPPRTRKDAVQSGARLEHLRDEARDFALAHGYTEEQLDGTTVSVSETQFLDRTHARVTFTLTIPGRGPVIVDGVGYAVHDGERWRVAARTMCDLLSLTGLLQPCPPDAG